MVAGLGSQFGGTVCTQLISLTSSSWACDMRCRISDSVICEGDLDASDSHANRRFTSPDEAICNCSGAVWAIGAVSGQTFGVGTIGWAKPTDVRIYLFISMELEGTETMPTTSCSTPSANNLHEGESNCSGLLLLINAIAPRK